MITGLPNSFVETIQTNDSLERYLLSLSQEVPSTKRSWLYEDQEPQWILDTWKNHLSTLENGDTFEKEVFQFDTSSEEKWGPQGGHAPMSELLDSIVLPTFQDVSPRPSVFGIAPRHEDDVSYGVCDKDWGNAISKVVSCYRLNQVSCVRPAALNSVVEDMRARDTLESNSGWPDFRRRNLPEVKQAALKAASDGSYRNYPAIALLRTYRQKTRLVWMFPMSANLVEGQFYQPLQNSIVKAGMAFYAPWKGFEECRSLITRAYDQGKFVYASDFSSTDSHFKQATSMQAYFVLENLFKNNLWQQQLWQSLLHMHNIPLIVGLDQMITGSHGVSSGSNWTNFIETVFDHIFAAFVSDKTGIEGLYAIGDDMAWVSSTFNEDFPAQLEELAAKVGQITEAKKTNANPDKVKTLQRLFQRGYRRPDGQLRGVYPTIRALNSSVYPERFHNPKTWSSDVFCARQYMILENCVDHPLFEEFVKFVVKGQKDLIPFAKKSSADLRRIHRQSKLIPGLNPTYNQERRDSSLENFASIRWVAENL
nr:MAG: RNA-dependent RNA-polymerase [Picobirnavirus sp.]